MRLRHISHTGALAAILCAFVVGCAVSPGPDLPTTADTFAPEPGVPSPTTDSHDTTPELPNATPGYIDMGYGLSIPADGPGDCAGPAWLYMATTGGITTKEILRPEYLVDMGPRTFAQGEVTYDDEGRIATYTVASGDVVNTIGLRFCLVNGQAIATLNGYNNSHSIQPGDVLIIDPAAASGD